MKNLEKVNFVNKRMENYHLILGILLGLFAFIQCFRWTIYYRFFTRDLFVFVPSLILICFLLNVICVISILFAGIYVFWTERLVSMMRIYANVNKY